MKDYIGWAVGKGYAVIDVNIPKHVTIEPVSILPNLMSRLLLTCLLSPGNMKTRKRTAPQRPRNWLHTSGTTTLSEWDKDANGLRHIS